MEKESGDDLAGPSNEDIFTVFCQYNSQCGLQFKV